MRINADFDALIAIAGEEMAWTPSPMAGVERKMLDRVGGEVARATSIVRYAAGSSFSEHEHGGGEEFLVLEGIFSDETGDFPKGRYVRNPIGTRHRPHSDPGCTIFVKLHQFDPDDREQKSVDIDTLAFAPTGEDSVEHAILHDHGSETVTIERWAPGAKIERGPLAGGAEILILDGGLNHIGQSYGPHSWLRIPDGGTLSASSASGCRLYMKSGHLIPARIAKWTSPTD